MSAFAKGHVVVLGSDEDASPAGPPSLFSSDLAPFSRYG